MFFALMPQIVSIKFMKNKGNIRSQIKQNCSSINIQQMARVTMTLSFDKTYVMQTELSIINDTIFFV